ncbi:hypothetical protein J3R30DRAFT_3813834 [Lentinula aciculospora]|uniref:Alpha-amylase domain-containing protein n=1 Tax=Lentinula aciculospora TaxID=153920 RepID=A0A9W9AL77_9AGAR|nr:hypothetical protein J3R30DRAFT_3813834 [Lentinula aciculospora]
MEKKNINDGIPILYLGQEQGYQGGSDPANRGALWLSGFDVNKPLLAHVRTLNAARRQATSYHPSFLNTQASFIPQSSASSTLVMSKPPLLTLLTNGGSSSSETWTIPSSAGLYSSNETLVDVLTCATVTTGSDGTLTFTASNGLPKVLMPAKSLGTTGSLCLSEAED